MIYEVTTSASELKIIPTTELEEIAQNILMIITTQKFTAPLDRGFGLSTTQIDEPISAGQAKIAAEIVAAVKEFEPRAQITNVFFDGNFANGELNIRVQFKIIEKNLRGGVF